MKRVMEIGRRFAREEDGIAVTEYGLLLAGIAVGLLLAVAAFRTRLEGFLKEQTTKLFGEAAS
jgi:Flp pilus assembly pilin Flp